MLFLWKTIVIPRLDYCSQLWNPSKAYLITQLEELQKHFVRRIHGFQDMEYNEALHELNLLSLQRRRERYHIIYLWCIIEDIYPNLQNEQDDVLIKLQSSIQSRRGRTIATKVLPNTRYGNLRFQSLPLPALGCSTHCPSPYVISQAVARLHLNRLLTVSSKL